MRDLRRLTLSYVGPLSPVSDVSWTTSPLCFHCGSDFAWPKQCSTRSVYVPFTSSRRSSAVFASTISNSACHTCQPHIIRSLRYWGGSKICRYPWMRSGGRTPSRSTGQLVGGSEQRSPQNLNAFAYLNIIVLAILYINATNNVTKCESQFACDSYIHRWGMPPPPVSRGLWDFAEIWYTATYVRGSSG